jgi:hypothetical protein
MPEVNTWKETAVRIIKIEPGSYPDYLNERTGRCHTCRARFMWPTKLGKLKDSTCPFCGERLQQTTYQWKGDTYRITEVDSTTDSPWNRAGWTESSTPVVSPSATRKTSSARRPGVPGHWGGQSRPGFRPQAVPGVLPPPGAAACP